MKLRSWRITLITLALTLLVTGGRAAQEKSPDTPYEGEIRESDIREREIRQSMMRGEAPPVTLRLRFRGERLWIYLAFYDLEGREIWFYYREDRFDDRGKKKIRNLVKGAAYEVKGEYMGLYGRDRLIAPGDPLYQEALADSDSRLVYRYTGSLPLKLEQILF